MPACETRRDCGNDAELVVELNERLYGVCNFCFLNSYVDGATATSRDLEVLE